MTTKTYDRARLLAKRYNSVQAEETFELAFLFARLYEEAKRAGVKPMDRLRAEKLDDSCGVDKVQRSRLRAVGRRLPAFKEWHASLPEARRKTINSAHAMIDHYKADQDLEAIKRAAEAHALKSMTDRTAATPTVKAAARPNDLEARKREAEAYALKPKTKKTTGSDQVTVKDGVMRAPSLDALPEGLRAKVAAALAKEEAAAAKNGAGAPLTTSMNAELEAAAKAASRNSPLPEPKPEPVAAEEESTWYSRYVLEHAKLKALEKELEAVKAAPVERGYPWKGRNKKGSGYIQVADHYKQLYEDEQSKLKDSNLLVLQMAVNSLTIALR
jgi:hypothetical protein